MVLQIIFENSNFKFFFHKTCDKRRKFNHLGCKSTHCLHMQRCGWRILYFLFVFQNRVLLNNLQIQNVMTKPLGKCNSATRKFDNHELKSKTHKTSMLTMQS